MAVHSIDTAVQDTDVSRRIIMQPRPLLAVRTIKLRLDVVAGTVVDAIEFAGGLICDHAMAGWDVTAIVADQSDRLPLQILGAKVVDLEYALASEESAPNPHSLAVEAYLLTCESFVRRGVIASIGRRSTEVMMWGEKRDAKPDSRGFEQVDYQPSIAARAFKENALIAAAAAPVQLPERFYKRTASGFSATDISYSR